ncbi:MAG: deoxyribose-phosphate aldolase [Elusimicrobia bacterium]|nr:deoxyribose-phosphate aldolase [Elusimicrobiota bacterium]
MAVSEKSVVSLLDRNPIHSFDPSILGSLHIDATGVAARVEKTAKARTPKKDHQAAWIKAAISMMDLTTLEGADTPGRVERLCAKAVRPVPDDPEVRVAAVCVYGNLTATAKKLLEGTGVKTAVVSTAFPHGQTPLAVKIEETKQLAAQGADEIDMVVNRNAFLSGDYYRVYEEIAEVREACGDVHLKVILETGELGSLQNVWIASEIAMQAGADFIKTSTGKIQPAATPDVGLVMFHAIDHFYRRKHYKVGMKPAGGIRTSKQALQWLALVKETLGDGWLDPALFRIGASSLLDDAVRQLHHLETGQYESYDYIPKG